MRQKIKSWLEVNKKDVYLAFIVTSVALIGFAIGRISALAEEKFEIQISGANIIDAESIKTIDDSPVETKKGEKASGRIVVSKNGEVYHLESCSGAKRIKEENKIYFSSIEEAMKAGYRPAANCPGL